MAKKVTVYVMKDDPHSQNVCSLLKELKVSFDQIDVSDDETKVNDLVDATGQWSVPAIVMRDDSKPQQVIIGNDPQSIRTLFESHK